MVELLSKHQTSLADHWKRESRHCQTCPPTPYGTSSLHVVTMALVSLCIFQECGIVPAAMSASTVMSLLVEDDPLAYSEGSYNTEIKVNNHTHTHTW